MSCLSHKSCNFHWCRVNKRCYIKNFEEAPQKRSCVIQSPVKVSAKPLSKTKKKNSNYKINLKTRVLNKTGGVCYLCPKKLTLKNMTFDHFIPKSKGGKTTFENLMPCCGKCNSKKGNKMPY